MKNIKYLLPLLSLLSCMEPEEKKVITARSVESSSQVFKEIKGLEDCSYSLIVVDHSWLHVIRCPNSSTNVKYNCGKNCQRSITVTDSPFEKEPD